MPIPKIDEIYARLEGSAVYSTFDMRSGYYHLELTPESQPKSAFVVGADLREASGSSRDAHLV